MFQKKRRCSICKEQFSSKREKKDHKKTIKCRHCPREVWLCSKRGKWIRNNYGFCKIHGLDGSPKEERTCCVCNSILINKYYYYKHMNSTTRCLKSPFPVLVCSEKGKNIVNGLCPRHLKERKEEMLRNTCHSCNKYFMKGFSSNIYNHLNEKMECHICHKKFLLCSMTKKEGKLLCPEHKGFVLCKKCNLYFPDYIVYHGCYYY